MKILVFDTDETCLAKCNTILLKNGFKILSSSTHKKAIKYLHSDSQIQLAICCVPGHRQEGYQLIQYINENLRFNHIHVIAISDKNDSAAVIKCRRLRVKAYLLKPVSEKILLDRINVVIESCFGTILIVTCDPLIANILVKSIQRENYKAIAVNSVSEAMALVKSTKIDVVISDLIILPSSGLDLLVQVKEVFPNMPFVLITENSNKLNREYALQAGADSAICRPFHNIQISRTLRSLINSGRA